MVTNMWEGLVLRSAITRGVTPADPNYEGSLLLMRPHFDLERPNSAWQHIKGGACFTGSTTPLHIAQCVARFVSDS